MAKDNETQDQAQTKTRRPQGPRPIHVLYQASMNGNGEPDAEVVHVTRDANEVIDMIQENPNLKHKKVETKIGR